jgi:23S rRNA (adenine-N6)-dimethyltransferase
VWAFSPRLGQHFLKSPELAASLVQQIHVASLDLVVEVGAGNGILTEELAGLAAKVVAVEVDPTLAISLIKRFSNSGKVVVVAGDFFDLPLPADLFRVFGNIPFGSTTRLLRHLLDPPVTGLVRADLVVQHGAAIKRTRRGNLP